jgi:hypothetical protein
MENFPLHILLPVLSDLGSAHLANAAQVNKSWLQLCSEILKPRASQREHDANLAIISKARLWVFRRAWLLADDLNLSAQTHIDIKNFIKVHDILQKIGSADKVDSINLRPLFCQTHSFFDTRQAPINLQTIEQTLNLLTCLRHAFSNEGIYNKDEVAVCVFYLMFTYIVIPEILVCIQCNPTMTARIPLQVSMAKRCFCARLPLQYDSVYNYSLQHAERSFRAQP